MDTAEDSVRSDLFQRLSAAAQQRAGAARAGVDLPELAQAYYRHVAAEEIADRSDADLLGPVLHQLRLAGDRPQGSALVRVFTPTVADNGWSAQGHTVVEIVTDDMPFLVDSVSMELDRGHHDVHLVVHPQLVVRRDVAGELQEILDDRASAHEHDRTRESWMHLEIDRVPEEAHDQIRSALERVLSDVREAVEDWQRMHAKVDGILATLEKNPPPVAPGALAEGLAFLRWLGENHFTFLGYREYHLAAVDGQEVLTAVPGTGYGILRSDPSGPGVLPPEAAAHARDPQLLVIAKTNAQSTVHRPVHMDYVGVKMFGPDGEVIGEQRFLGLFSSAAYHESVTRIPLLREKVDQVLDQAGLDAMSHAGKALMDVLETYPRDELFQTPVEDLVPMASQVMHTRERRQLRLFVRRETYGRYLSCLIYLPRDRYNTAVRERIAAILRTRLHAGSVEYTAHVGEAFAARLHFVVRPEPGHELAPVDVADLERRCAEAARSWRDDLVGAVLAEHGEERGSRLARRYADAFPEAYKEDYSAATAASDLDRLEEIAGEEGLSLALHEPVDAREGEARLKIFRAGPPLSLSEVLPVLSTMGVEVVDERPYRLEGLERESWIYDFGLRYTQALPDQARRLFAETVTAVWEGRNESDGFNALVLSAGLSWRQVIVMRAYARYMRQGGTPFAQDSIEEALRLNVDITRGLVQLFEARFDPGRHGDIPADSEGRVAKCAEIEERVVRALDDVASLDQDRILRSYLDAIKASLRTNFYQRDADGQHHPYLSIKLDPAGIGFLPEPRPRYEIFVYAPRVEGVHLRFGAVARGGLRWSDRRDDFRTEVLGLVKAQMVKNTVIVPVGAKGGFYPKALPDASDRDAWMAEGIACYRTFISGLLDVTDNLVAGEVVPPEGVVRHDGDDTYLVVAADKGTATFSDIANQLAKDYGYWLGDAFASGGSVGYDHKAMGITAKGAWVSVRRHFRDRGIDCQTEDFTCVGIGDMSGDVFGNGMLCSEHIRLVAAFDHRDIFLDPDPDPETSFAERKRLFDLPRSSWKDYDTSLISEGGGVYPRSAKSIRLSSQAQQALGIEAAQLTPAELMRAILLAPVDLLWNGGIGTYVKASSESHGDAGDKANDAIRVDGAQLRAACVGEGGNLGFTQRGRVEYALRGCDGAGGRINTDFIDNSAGVDTSDHEVNIKILLDKVVDDGDLTEKQRNQLLATMTDEVAELVLADNYDQNLAIANSLANAPALLHVHEDWMRTLERQNLLNRELEALPSRSEVAARRDRGEGLTAPELSVLLAYTKIVLAEVLLETDIAEDPFLRSDLYAYFPEKMRQGYRTQMEQHPLHREIVVTKIVNDLVNGAGLSFHHRLGGETAAPVASLVRANFVAREVYGAARMWRYIASFDNVIAASVQTRMRLEVRTLVERASRWLVTNRRAPLDSEALVDQFEVTVEKLMTVLPDLLVGAEREEFEERRDALMAEGVPEDLAVRVAACPPAYTLLGVVEISTREDLDPEDVAKAHFALGERLGLPLLVSRILSLPRTDRWQTMARASLRDDLHSVHAQLTAQELAGHAPGDDEVARAVAQLQEIAGEEDSDLARLSVALRVVRGLLD
ncbi:MAG: NAD-glutamate dehydrogenase [Marmoricola sp.]